MDSRLNNISPMNDTHTWQKVSTAQQRIYQKTPMSPFDWAVIDIKHGPRGTQQNNVQNSDPRSQKHRMKTI